MAIAGAAAQAGEPRDLAFSQAVATAAQGDADIAEHYRQSGFAPLWTGDGPVHAARRAALIAALDASDLHGLPRDSYRVDDLITRMERAESRRDLGRVEVALTRAYLAYARDVQTGVLIPSRVDANIVREVPYRARGDLLAALATRDAADHMRSLAPATRTYTALTKHKILLERALARGGWGPTVPGEAIKPGESGARVVALRNRLIAMGYLAPTPGQSYDTRLARAVTAFQAAHGLAADGVAGPATLAEINRPLAERLQAVIVAMERERWLNTPRGARHIVVNQTDFSASIVDDGKVTFQTRAVIGKNQAGRRSPEFSDVMDHMVINPTWYVPRSIVTKEYLPKMQRNPNAHSYLQITDRRGRPISRGAVDFAAYSASTFPYAMRQPPSKRNALGLVKFMFPNQYNIYLHDTPQKSLFDRDLRAFSHGCIRLADPFDFAYALLAAQEDDPEGYFQSILRTGKERRVELETHVPVHLIYRTAVISPKGALEFRRDVYGRDARIWEALSRAGVVLAPGSG